MIYSQPIDDIIACAMLSVPIGGYLLLWILSIMADKPSNQVKDKR
jgi:hypothetical protein